MLDAGVAVRAPSGAKQAVWSELATKLPAATAGAAAGGLSVLSVLKPLAVGLALGTLTTVGALEIWHKIAPVPPLSASASATRVTSPPERARPSEVAPTPMNQPSQPDSLAPARPIKAAPSPGPVEGHPSSSASAASRGAIAPGSDTSAVAAFADQAAPAPQENATVRESRRLNSARAALQAGAARRALAQLDAIAAEFPSGVLVQERDALRIEALLALGERQRAQELARRFLERHPQSPHAAAVQRALH